jgi:type I restriction enzyme S subunit
LSSHQGRYIARGERNLTEEGLKNSSARLVPANTVLLTSRAPVGYLAIAQNPVTTNQGFRSLVVKEGFSPEFIYYLLLHNVEYLKQHASGSTFQELSGGTLKNLQFCIPDLKIQKKIAQTLSDLDAKIELNQQMNKTLETMAQLLFKQWFVDFEFPNEEGQPYMSSGGKMVGSELGKIPEGWETASLTDIVDVLGGGTPSTGVPSYWDGETPFFTPRDVSESCYTIKTDKNVTKEGLITVIVRCSPKTPYLLRLEALLEKFVWLAFLWR